MPGGCIPESKRVQAPLGAPVLWSVRFAPNHGLSPQSGLVQRGGKRFLRLTGLSPRGFLGLTALSGLKVVVAAGAASIYAACRQRWWTPLKMKGAMMIKPRSRPAGEARLYGFFIPRSGITKLIARRAIPQPSAPQAPSTLRTLRTFGPEGRQPSRPKGRVQSRHHPLNPPAESGQNLLNLLNPGRSAALFISTV